MLITRTSWRVAERITRASSATKAMASARATTAQYLGIPYVKLVVKIGYCKIVHHLNKYYFLFSFISLFTFFLTNSPFLFRLSNLFKAEAMIYEKENLILFCCKLTDDVDVGEVERVS